MTRRISNVVTPAHSDLSSQTKKPLTADVQSEPGLGTLVRMGRQRFIRLKALVQALTRQKEMHAGEIADLLGCSMPAASKYIEELQEIQVVEIARYIEGGGTAASRPVYKVAANRERITTIWLHQTGSPALSKPTAQKKRCLSRQLELTPEPPEAISNKSGRHSSRRSAEFVTTHRRDPLVAALFGEIRLNAH